MWMGRQQGGAHLTAPHHPGDDAGKSSAPGGMVIIASIRLPAHLSKAHELCVMNQTGVEARHTTSAVARRG